MKFCGTIIISVEFFFLVISLFRSWYHYKEFLQEYE